MNYQETQIELLVVQFLGNRIGMGLNLGDITIVRRSNYHYLTLATSVLPS